jgi:hypothetical protein
MDRLNEALVDGVDDLPDSRMECGEQAGENGPISAFHPRLATPSVRANETAYVEQVSPANRILEEVTISAGPDSVEGGAGDPTQSVTAHECAPDDLPGEVGRVGAGDLATHDRVDPIRTYNGFTSCPEASIRFERNLILLLDHIYHALTKVDFDTVRCARGLQERLSKVTAMKVVGSRPKALFVEIAKLQLADNAPALAPTKTEPWRVVSRRLQRRVDS